LSTFERIERIVIELLGLEEGTLTPDTEPKNVEGWDSLANVSVVFGVEEEFGVEFTADQLKGFATVGDFARGVDEALARA
jgi:acyl carrier protein